MSRLLIGVQLVGMLSVLGCQPSSEQDAPNQTEPGVSVETLKGFIEAFNRHDLDAIMEFFAEDCVLYMPRGPDPWGERFVGKSEVRNAIAARLGGIPDVRYSDDRHWVLGDVGVSEWLLTGTTASGDILNVRGVDVVEFRNGKIIRKDAYWKIVDAR